MKKMFSNFLGRPNLDRGTLCFFSARESDSLLVDTSTMVHLIVSGKHGAVFFHKFLGNPDKILERRKKEAPHKTQKNISNIMS